MLKIEEVDLKLTNAFWEKHMEYLIHDEIIKDEEDIAYFSGSAYRKTLESHRIRDKDLHHMIYFMENGSKIGAAQYTTYQSEDGKCFILDYWIFPEFRNKGKGTACFQKLEEYTKKDGAHYYTLNSEKQNSIRFWKKLGFIEHGIDEFGMKLFIKK